MRVRRLRPPVDLVVDQVLRMGANAAVFVDGDGDPVAERLLSLLGPGARVLETVLVAGKRIRLIGTADEPTGCQPVVEDRGGWFKITCPDHPRWAASAVHPPGASLAAAGHRDHPEDAP